jgi:stearoyl-CoA desaturase (delta-9 desaturase)
MIKNSHFWKVWFPPHLFAILGCLYFFSPIVLLWAFIFYCLISGLGIAVGFHRYFSHKSFETNKVWQQIMLYLGCLACHGNPLFWVALHVGLHHRHADTEKDPHSPIHGIWTSYQGYAFNIKPEDVPIKAGANILRHKEWMWTVNHYNKIIWLTWLVAFICLFVYPPISVGLVIAQVYAIHQEALVNLVGHLKGFGSYRNYETKDDSVNRPILGYFTWGQSLHNNHHGNPGNASFATNKGIEFDPSMIWINLIKNN